MYNDSVFYLTFILNMVLIVIENLHVPFLECREVNERCMWFELTLTCAYYYNIPTVSIQKKNKSINTLKTVATYYM